VLEGHRHKVTALIVSAELLFSGCVTRRRQIRGVILMSMHSSVDRTVRVWDRTGNCLKIIEGQLDAVQALLVWDWSLYVATSSHCIQRWNLPPSSVRHLRQSHIPYDMRP
jgi:WD40 repeat protein